MKISNSYNRNIIAPSELILNDDGSLYHTLLKDEYLADDIIVVGDQDRVEQISNHFDNIEIKLRSREFVTHTGTLNGHRLTVISTGIGVDNIDIVVNEIDAALNIDLKTRIPKENFRKVNIIRLGTTGTLQEDINVGDFIASKYAFGFDGVPWFYDPELTKNEEDLMNSFIKEMDLDDRLGKPYFAECDKELYDRVALGMIPGITSTANGFYGPQGRVLRLNLTHPEFIDQFRKFRWNGLRITNLEMECSGLYALASLLGHGVLTTCVVLANRYKGTFVEDHELVVKKLIDKVLEKLTN